MITSQALKLYAHPKIIAILFLGFSSGLPLALTGSILALWLREEGVSLTTIGLFGAIGIPYSLKFLWSPILDHTPIPFLTKYLGKRRSWMLVTQIALIITIAALGSSSPTMDPFYTAIIAIAVAFSSASQDIAIDAYRIEILEESQQGAGAATIVFGYNMAFRFFVGIGALILADQIGWIVTYYIMAASVIVGIVTTLIIKEPPAPSTEKLDSFTAIVKTAVIDPFSDFLLRPGSILILVFILFYKFGDAFAGLMTYPFFYDIGFSKTEIALIAKTFGLAATLVGAFIGGWLVYKIGMYRALFSCGILQMLSNLIFVLQAHLGANQEMLAITMIVENTSAGMGTTAFVAFISSLCHRHYTATQYALLSSLATIGRTTLSTSSGYFADTIGWTQFFILSTFAAIPGLITLLYLNKNNSFAKEKIVLQE